jgi:hypothetical protein
LSQIFHSNFVNFFTLARSVEERNAWEKSSKSVKRGEYIKRGKLFVKIKELFSFMYYFLVDLDDFEDFFFFVLELLFFDF